MKHMRERGGRKCKPTKKTIKRTIITLFTLALFTLGVMTWTFVKSIPSRGTTTRTDLEVNPGGSQCFDQNSWHFKIKHMHIHKIEDALLLGGTDPKSLLRSKLLPDHRFIWKPQLPIQGKHYASAQNEVLIYHLDCLLGLKRTPAAAIYDIEFNHLRDSLGRLSRKRYEERSSDSTFWDHWMNQGYVRGTAQFFWEDSNHLDIFTEYYIKYTTKFTQKYLGFSFKFFLFHLFGGTSTGIREYSQRDMLDYISGNWDRSHNQFYTHDVAGSSELIYLDHNHLSTNRGCKEIFLLQHCKFWEDSVEKLRSFVEKGNLTSSLLKTINTYDPEMRFNNEKIAAPLNCLQRRSELFLSFVAKCVAKHGYDYVFLD